MMEERRVKSNRAWREDCERLEALVAKQAAMIEQMRGVLEDVRGNINPERGFADELELDVAKVVCLKPCPEVLNKVRADAVRKAFKLMMDGRWRGDALDVLADRMEQGEA